MVEKCGRSLERERRWQKATVASRAEHTYVTTPPLELEMEMELSIRPIEAAYRHAQISFLYFMPHFFQNLILQFYFIIR